MKFDKIRILITLLSVFISINSIFSQDIATVDELNASASALIQTNGTESIAEVRRMVTKSLSMSIELNYSKGEIDAYNIMAETYELEGNPQIALKFRKRASKKQANPDAPSNVTIVKPKTIEDFAVSTIPNSAKSQAKAAQPKETQSIVSEEVQQPIETKKVVQSKSSVNKPIETTSGNTEKQIENKLTEIEEKQKLIEQLQQQSVNEESDSLAEIRQAEIAKLQAETEAAQSQIEALRKEKENNDLRLKQQQYLMGFLAVIVVLMLIFVFFVIRQIRAKNRANAELAKALEELKSTQEQLVQKEKLASLGQLTAGIAHEIQNPLNFVNNFADLSLELLQEIKESSDLEDIKAIADDLIQNLTKIYHHGKRADSIVKNMLQHSREQKGAKEPTDLNELLKEFSNLAYHGMRATNKDFNCKIVQSLDATIPKVSIVKQDLGRVFLNMFNNSFYSINKKIALNIDSYLPALEISTHAEGDKVKITIKDNGLGMSEEVKQKLFHPFFTTKPTGEGTGLGLSISHDIIVKLHNGEMQVESKEGEFAQFEITLPKQ
ncbi:MAG: hypothetical protein BGO32_04690 [Bacteroidetes bacterium 37-13]|nr:MAG: hypothetical protein BGO32_04690 [Bacteroidetes bacterium 37-13]